MLVLDYAWCRGKDPVCVFSLSLILRVAQGEKRAQELWPLLVVVGVFSGNFCDSISDLVSYVLDGLRSKRLKQLLSDRETLLFWNGEENLDLLSLVVLARLRCYASEYDSGVSASLEIAC